MTHSMTGYGKSSANIKTLDKKLNIEIKTLNNKFIDIDLYLPEILKPLDLHIRHLLKTQLRRGKVICHIAFDNSMGKQKQTPNIDIDSISIYAKTLEKQFSIPKNDVIPHLLNLPHIYLPEPQTEILNDDTKKEVLDLLQKAIISSNSFRKNEGHALKTDLYKSIENIKKYIRNIEVYEPQRIVSIKKKLISALGDFEISKPVDDERFQKELIYYLEKIDINEEKVRLNAHITFFTKTLDESIEQGKKLGFITQEMGREINTLGTKSVHAHIQKYVVEMKSELEKIKEIVLNIL